MRHKLELIKILYNRSKTKAINSFEISTTQYNKTESEWLDEDINNTRVTKSENIVINWEQTQEICLSLAFDYD